MKYDVNMKSGMESNGAKILGVLDQTSTTWTVGELVSNIADHTAFFGNAVQRSEVWDIERKSLLIHSLLAGYPVPAFFTVKDINDDEEAVWDFIDGKQRSLAMYEFVKDQFTLKNTPTIDVKGYDEPIDFNGCKYSELPSFMQSRITSVPLSIVQMNDLTPEQIAELFARLNNGKALSQQELTRVAAKCLDAIRRLAKHPIFEESCTDAQRKRYDDEDVVIKTLKLSKASDDEPTSYSLDSKDTRPFMKSLDVTDDDEQYLNKTLSTFADVHRYILDYDSNGWDNETRKLARRVAKKVYTRTNMVTLSYFINQHEEVDLYDVADFFMYFFSGNRAASIDRTYNDDCRSGANHASKVRERMNILDKYLDQFMNAEGVRDEFSNKYLVEKIR